MVRLMILAVALLSLSWSLLGCTNTVRGVGRDVSSMGHAMEDYNTNK